MQLGARGGTVQGWEGQAGSVHQGERLDGQPVQADEVLTGSHDNGFVKALSHWNVHHCLGQHCLERTNSTKKKKDEKYQFKYVISKNFMKMTAET